jgi:hypothetical protein
VPSSFPSSCEIHGELACFDPFGEAEMPRQLVFKGVSILSLFSYCGGEKAGGGGVEWVGHLLQ